MQNPQQEIPHVIRTLANPASPVVQASAVEKYMTEDVGFRHPLFRVVSGPNSRKRVLGIYRWYKTISPRVEVKVGNVYWDKARNVVLVEVEQKMWLRFCYFEPIAGSLLVRLTLRKIDGHFYIERQDDFYQPEDLAALNLSPALPMVRMALSASALVCNLGANVFSMFGIWKVPEATQPPTKDRQNNDQNVNSKN